MKKDHVFNLNFRPASYFTSLTSKPLHAGTVIAEMVTFGSMTGSVQTVLVHSKKGKIHYSITDDFEMSLKYQYSPKSSTKPLSMKELIQLIDTAKVINEDQKGLVKGFWRAIAEENLDSVKNSMTVMSNFYPELSSYYKQQERLYISELRTKRNAEEKPAKAKRRTELRRSKLKKTAIFRNAAPLFPTIFLQNKSIKDLSMEEVAGLARWAAVNLGVSGLRIENRAVWINTVRICAKWRIHGVVKTAFFDRGKYPTVGDFVFTHLIETKA